MKKDKNGVRKSDTSPDEQIDDKDQKRANADENAAARGKGKGQEEKEPDKDEEKDEEYERSLNVATISEEALLKAVREVERVAGATSDDRRAELAKKLAEGTLEKAEREELTALLAADEGEHEEPLFRSEPYQDAITADQQIKDGIDAVPWLERFAMMHIAALDELKNGLVKGQERGEAFDKALGSAIGSMGRYVVQQGKLIKALSDRLQQVEAQPLPRRSLTPGLEPLRRSIGTPGNGSGQLNGPTIEQAFMQMNVTSRNEGRNGLSKSGEDLGEAWAIFSKSSYLSPGIQREINEIVGQ